MRRPFDIIEGILRRLTRAVLEEYNDSQVNLLRRVEAELDEDENEDDGDDYGDCGIEGDEDGHEQAAGPNPFHGIAIARIWTWCFCGGRYCSNCREVHHEVSCPQFGRSTES